VTSLQRGLIRVLRAGAIRVLCVGAIRVLCVGAIRVLRVGAECGREGEGGRHVTRICRQKNNGTHTNTCMSLVTLRHIHDPMLLS
jgi:hypothetical protein